MNILLATAVMIAATTAQASPEPYRITLESKAIVIVCQAPRQELVCFNMQDRRFAIHSDSYYPIGLEFTVGFTFECDLDENCKVVDVRDID